MKRGDGVCSSRASAEYSFFAAKSASHLERVLVGDVDDLVDVFEVNVFGNDLLADTFNKIGRGLHELPCFFVCLEHRTVRVGADHADLRVLLFQVAAGSANRSAGANARDKVSDSSFGLLPDLVGCAVIVREPVGLVRVLIGVEI